jgi:predicted anti-sigma-YlaC factor YlaD
MTEHCPNSFDEKLISGFLDGELTQAADQRVRIHIEDCARCRELLEDLAGIREAAMRTDFVQPTDDQWDERPRTAAGGGTRAVGWLLAIIWAVAVSGFGLWHVWTDVENVFERLLVFGGIAAFGLLLLSVVIDRVRSARSDRYREVEK